MRKGKSDQVKPRPSPDLGQLIELAEWAKQARQKQWRRLAVDPLRLAAQLKAPGVPRVGAEEFLFCLGWAELAWDQFTRGGKRPLDDAALVKAIIGAIGRYDGDDVQAG